MVPFKPRPTVCAQDHEHPSKLEAGRCDELHVLQAAGKLTKLELQPVFEFVENGRRMFRYTPDFAWFSGDVRVIEEVKTRGTSSDGYRLRKKLIEARYGVVIAEWPVRARRRRKKR